MGTEVFMRKAPVLMARLMHEFKSWGVLDAAACAGNGGGESGGFTAFQEINPTVKGSAGGFGWFQWTGPRRRAFMAWCKKQGLDPKSDEANIGYCIVELKGDEKHTIAAVAAANGLEAKVKAFERAFERAGKPNYAGRIRWAQRALDAYEKYGTPANPSPANTTSIKPVAAIVDAEVVERVQTALTHLNYAPGGIDGKVGTLTRGAILAFREDNKLPLNPYIDAELIAVLETAKPRELAPERAKATTTEVAAKVPEVNSHWWNKYLALGAGVPVALTGSAEYIAPAGGYVQQAMGMFDNVPMYVWIGGFVILCGAMWWNARKGEVAGTEAYQKGERR